MDREFSLGGKWLELLKETAPGVKRVAVLRDPTLGGGTGYFAAIQAAAPSLRVDVRPINMEGADEIERGIRPFTGLANDGLVVTPGARTLLERDLIVTLAARQRLPTVYSDRLFVSHRVRAIHDAHKTSWAFVPRPNSSMEQIAKSPNSSL